MGRGCYSKVVKVERGGEGVYFKGIKWCVGDEQSIERCGREDVGFWNDAIDGQAIHGRDDGRKRRRIMKT